MINKIITILKIIFSYPLCVGDKIKYKEGEHEIIGTIVEISESKHFPVVYISGKMKMRYTDWQNTENYGCSKHFIQRIL